MPSRHVHKTAASAAPPALFVRATALGTGGIATFVLDGWGLASKLQPILISRKPLRLAEHGALQFARVTDSSGQVIDEVVVAVLESHYTVTGMEQIELSCHGGMGSAAAVEQALTKAGFQRGTHADLAARAHENHKLSLVAMEAQLRLGRAVTPRQAELLLGYLDFQARWEKLGFGAAMGMRQRDGAWRAVTLDAARAALSGWPVARAVLSAHHAVLAGPVNAGKSTLANLLARSDKHIVSDTPGTTRDRLDTRLAILGLDVTISDTAGLSGDERKTGGAGSRNGEIEREGQRRARTALESASLRIVVLDGSKAPVDRDVELIAACKKLGPSLLVLNKSDLGLDESAEGLEFLAGVKPVSLSARNGLGLEKLEEAIERALLRSGGTPAAEVSGRTRGGRSAAAPITQRQADMLLEIQSCIENCWEDTMTIRAIMKLVGSRNQPEQLARVLSEL